MLLSGESKDWSFSSHHFLSLNLPVGKTEQISDFHLRGGGVGKFHFILGISYNEKGIQLVEPGISTLNIHEKVVASLNW